VTSSWSFIPQPLQFCALSQKDTDCGVCLLQICRHILHGNTRVMTRNKICFSGPYLNYNRHIFLLAVDTFTF